MAVCLKMSVIILKSEAVYRPAAQQGVSVLVQAGLRRDEGIAPISSKWMHRGVTINDGSQMPANCISGRIHTEQPCLL